MFEELYTTKMSSEKKFLQNRFSKIRSKNGRFSKFMSLIIAIMVAMTMLCATIVMAALNSDGNESAVGSQEKDFITFYSNGKFIELQNKPFIKNNMAYFPLQEVFEKLNVFEVKGNALEWDNETIHVTVSEAEDRQPVCYTLNINSEQIDVTYNHTYNQEQTSEEKIVLAEDTPVLLIEDTTYVPYPFLDYMLNRGLGKNSGKFNFMFTVNSDNPTAFISQGFAWPFEGIISNSFQNKSISHNGIDIAAQESTDVKSAINGIVSEVGFDTENGNYIVIEKNSVKTVYAQLSEILVAEGDNVSIRQSIGKVGKSDVSAEAHLHFEVLINNEYYNPELIL